MPAISSHDLNFLWFPAALLAYYVACWSTLARNPKIESVTPQYEPPSDVSPGVARYILTGGSDGTTLAAVLAELAAKRVITIEPRAGSYQITLIEEDARLLPEEAALLKAALNVPLPIQNATRAGSTTPAATQRQDQTNLGDRVAPSSLGTAVRRSRAAVLNPKAPEQVKSILDAIQESFRKNLQGVYFRWNGWCAGSGTAATFFWSVANASSFESRQTPDVFLTFWLLFMTSIAGLILGGVITAKPTRPTMAQRLQFAVIPLLFFVLLDFSLPASHCRPHSLLCCRCCWR